MVMIFSSSGSMATSTHGPPGRSCSRKACVLLLLLLPPTPLPPGDPPGAFSCAVMTLPPYIDLNLSIHQCRSAMTTAPQLTTTAMTTVPSTTHIITASITWPSDGVWGRGTAFSFGHPLRQLRGDIVVNDVFIPLVLAEQQFWFWEALFLFDEARDRHGVDVQLGG